MLTRKAGGDADKESRGDADKESRDLSCSACQCAIIR